VEERFSCLTGWQQQNDHRQSETNDSVRIRSNGQSLIRTMLKLQLS